MPILKLYNQNQEQFEVSLIRYFKFDEISYLLYQQKPMEVDEEGYGRAYIGTVIDHHLKSIDEENWRKIKDLLKDIVRKNNNEEPLPIEDLDYHEITNFIIEDCRVFRFAQDYLEVLKKNNPFLEEKKSIGIKEAIRIPSKPAVEQPNYKILYEQQKEKNKKLEEELLDLQNKTLSYQVKYDQIKKILEEQEEKTHVL